MNRTLSLALARFAGGLLFWVIVAVRAQPNPAYDPPPRYYSGNGGLTGAALKSALHQIIRIHTVIPYTSTSTEFRDPLKVLDEDPANPSNVLLVLQRRELAEIRHRKIAFRAHREAGHLSVSIRRSDVGELPESTKGGPPSSRCQRCNVC